jgi:hypothetical protein
MIGLPATRDVSQITAIETATQRDRNHIAGSRDISKNFNRASELFSLPHRAMKRTRSAGYSSRLSRKQWDGFDAVCYRGFTCVCGDDDQPEFGVRTHRRHEPPG